MALGFFLCPSTLVKSSEILKKMEMGQIEEGQSAKMQFYFPAVCYFCAT